MRRWLNGGFGKNYRRFRMPINTQAFGNTQAHSDTDQRDDGSVTNRQDNHISLMEVKKYLQEMKFPANKNDLVEYAKQQHAPDHILNILEQLPTSEFASTNAANMTEYNSLDDLLHEIERID
jgi:hypothetical protein